MPPLHDLKTYKAITLRFFKNLFFPRRAMKRNTELVQRDYTKSWSQDPSMIIGGKKLRWHRDDGRSVYFRTADSRKFFISYIHHTVASLRPETVLELGSGVGQNLLALAILHPEIKKFVGIELTEAGVRTAKIMLANPPIAELMYLTEKSEEVIRRRLKEASIEFIQGSLLALPFASNSFDFVFSCLVFEQIPTEYMKGFREAHRITNTHALFLEEFREAQNIFQKMHLRNVDYFRARYTEILTTGFDLLRFEPLSLDTVIFAIGGLLCQKKK